MFSHLDFLVWLNRTLVNFPPWCDSFWEGMKTVMALSNHKQPHRDPLEGVAGTRSDFSPNQLLAVLRNLLTTSKRMKRGQTWTRAT